MQCVAKFTEFNFQLYNFPKYGEYFKDDSIFILPAAGTYKGADGIEEYVKFASPFSPYIDSKLPSTEQVVPVAADDATKTCIFYRFSVDYSKSMAATTLGAYSYSFTGMLKLTYSASESYLRAIHLDLPQPFLQWFFGELLNDRKTHEYVCGVMEASCPDTWISNGLASAGECIEKLEALPDLTGGKWADGKDRGCRVLHASFAANNPAHCAHISFRPEQDPHCKIKCQVSAGLKPTEFFPPEAYAQWQAFRDKNDVPPSGFTKELIA